MINKINKFASGASYQAVVNRSPINNVFIDPSRWYSVVREIVYFEVEAEQISNHIPIQRHYGWKKARPFYGMYLEL